MAGLWYRAGTVSVTNGSKKVTGFGSQWKTTTYKPDKGHTFWGPDGKAYEIDYVESDTVLYLVMVYAGVTAASQAYSIDITRTSTIPAFSRELSAQLAYAQAQYDSWQQVLTGADMVTLTAPDGQQVQVPALSAFQPTSASLKALQALTPAKDKLPVFNGPAGAELITLTPFMRTLLDDASLTDTQKTLKLPTAGGFGFRNKLINGDFRITQRGTSGTIAAGQTVLTADRWIVETYGSSVAWGVDSYTTGYPDFYLIGASGNTSIGLSQRIEAANCTNLPGNKVTISFRLYGNSAAGSGGVVVTPYLYAAGSTDNFSAPTFVEAFPAVNVIEGIKSVVATSAVLPASVAKGLQLQFEIRGLDAASKPVAFLDVQLEIGEVATPFEHRPYQTELALCQRYFVNKRTTYAGAMPVNNGVFAFVCEHPVSMRTTPTLIWTEGYNAGGASFVETSNLSVHSSRILYRNFSGAAPGGVDIDGSLLCTAEL